MHCHVIGALAAFDMLWLGIGVLHLNVAARIEPVTSTIHLSTYLCNTLGSSEIGKFGNQSVSWEKITNQNK